MFKKSFAAIALAVLAVIAVPTAANASGYAPATNITVTGDVAPGGIVVINFANNTFTAGESISFTLTGENAAGVAMMEQASQLAERMHEAATTHKTVGLAAHGEPMKAMLAAISGEVGRDGKPALESADVRLPHLAQPVIAIAAQGGLHAAVGQDFQMAANDTVALLSGADTQFVTGGQLRVHAGEAIGMLGGAVKPGEGGIGLQLVAAQDDIVFQAQSDTLTVQARDEVNVISANAHIDWAAAKSINLSTAGGANIAIEGGSITVQCPGKLTIHAGVKDFDGPGRTSYEMPLMPQGDFALRRKFPFSL